MDAGNVQVFKPEPRPATAVADMADSEPKHALITVSPCVIGCLRCMLVLVGGGGRGCDLGRGLRHGRYLRSRLGKSANITEHVRHLYNDYANMAEIDCIG